LKQKKLEYADRAAKVGKVSIKPTFPESLSLLRTAFEKADPKFREILDEYIENGQIDVYPKKGKRAAPIARAISICRLLFCLIMSTTFDSFKTFAHEMGHAIHTELSKKQPVCIKTIRFQWLKLLAPFFENCF
jgi:oligoendopeptidase F